MTGNNTFICVMYRDGGAERYSNLQTILKYYHERLPDLEIILVEEDSESKLKDIPPWVNHVFVKNSGSFNQGWAVNTAAKISKRPIGASVCNDAIIKWYAFFRAEEEVLKNHYACYIPYHRFYDFNQQQTEDFKRNFVFRNNENVLEERYHNRPDALRAGGIIFFDREALLNIGGFNENFRGWGAEDDEYAFRCKSLGLFGQVENLDKKFYNASWNLYHLYHSTTVDHKNGNNDSKVNRDLYSKILSYNPEQIKNLIKELKSNGIGDPKKYLKLEK